MTTPLTKAREALEAYDKPPGSWEHFLVRCEHGHDICGSETPPTPEQVARRCDTWGDFGLCEADPAENFVVHNTGTKPRPDISPEHLRAALAHADALERERDSTRRLWQSQREIITERDEVIAGLRASRDTALLELARLREVEKAAKAVLNAHSQKLKPGVGAIRSGFADALSALSSALSPLPTKEST